MLEAMSCELPVITSDYGGPAYIVSEDCGIKINLKNYQNYIENLSDALIYLIRNDDIRLKMGSNARKRVESEFSVRALESKVFSIYQEIIERND